MGNARRSRITSRPGYRANQARISLALSEFTLPLLSRVYRAFDGDVVAAIVLGEIAHRNVETWLAEARNDENLLHDLARREQLMRPCNALSVAQSCGLPRETVRRKIVTLIDRGLVYRSAKNHLFLTRTVGDDFEDMNAALIEELLTTARRIESLLANQPTKLGPLRVD